MDKRGPSKEIDGKKAQSPDGIPATDDPVLAMIGVGRQLWESETGDTFVERLRSESLTVPPSRHVPTRQ